MESSFLFFIPHLILSFYCLLSFDLTLGVSVASIAEEHEYTYIEGSGRGPEDWGNLKPDWKACGEGKLQSPIDLTDRIAQVSPQLGDLERHYFPAPAVVENRGHDIMVKWKHNAGSIKIDGIDYYLQHCHWHSPAEHTFNGSRLMLEAHMVHYSSSFEKIAVVAITYMLGHSDPIISRVVKKVRSSSYEEQDLGIINPQDIISCTGRAYFRYIGSLTTPPCSEGVIWTVFIGAKTVSSKEIEMLKQAVDDGFESNARPTQPLGEKIVYLYPTM
ncbi:alpha carbonic anhydrase 7-like [Tripterygium wilfordii]|uniref:alpha carbonic anhydrase 7-like n=1 Tax=Tripterygium wilfordii TaxID=458696 RepID=UPI0018F82ED9|nr:alpha carbonic anhydrase 7-like [Tripterygium wilfordii]